jgi:hypothetical protein
MESPLGATAGFSLSRPPEFVAEQVLGTMPFSNCGGSTHSLDTTPSFPLGGRHLLDGLLWSGAADVELAPVALPHHTRRDALALEQRRRVRFPGAVIRLLGLARALLGSFLHVPGDVGASVLIAFPVLFFMYFVPGLGPHQLSQRLGLLLAFPQFP